MKKTQSNITLQCLKPDSGHFLRRKDATDPVHFATIVYLGVGDSPDNYIEVTAEEVEAYLAAHTPPAPAASEDGDADGDTHGSDSQSAEAGDADSAADV